MRFAVELGGLGIPMLLDTNILIDLGRGHPDAITWYRGEESDAMYVSGYAMMEYLAGEMVVPDKNRQQGKTESTPSGLPRNRQGVERLISRWDFEVLWPSVGSSREAWAAMQKLYPAQLIEWPDILSAFTAREFDMPFTTCDKRCGALRGYGVKLDHPYTRRPERSIPYFAERSR